MCRVRPLLDARCTVLRRWKVWRAVAVLQRSGPHSQLHTYTYAHDCARALRSLKREKVYQFTTPWLVDHSKYEAAFGLDVTPHADAAKQTVAWFKQHPPKPS